MAHQRLDDINNIRGTRIQSKLRLGIALLMARIARLCNWPRSDSLPETVEHYLLDCPALSRLRLGLCARLQECLPWAGTPGRALLTAFSTGGDTQLALLLGRAFSFGHWAQDRPRCGQARWLMDKCLKIFVLLAWKYRQDRTGQFVLAGGTTWSAPARKLALSADDMKGRYQTST